MPPYQRYHHTDGDSILIRAAPTASLDRTKEWEGCCVHAMGFEWVDQFEEEAQMEEQPMQQAVHQIINLLDEDNFEDDDFVLDDDDSKGKQQHSDAWMESALRMQADLDRMAHWIQSKQQE